MQVKQLIVATAMAASSVFAIPASAALYTNNFGSLATPGGANGNSSDGNISNCDDCYSAPVSFGAGQSIAYFGATYDSLFVGSNGYVTFGSGATSYSPAPLDTQTIGKMIAGLYTDLDSRDDDASNVFVNTDTLGQIVVTWQDMGHYAENYNVRNTFQLVIRSDQFLVAAGEGQIGFFYGDLTDPSIASAGFGDGLSDSNPGEVAFASQVPANTLSNNAPRFYNLEGGAPVVVPPVAGVPEPGSIALLGLGAMGLTLARRRRAK